MRNRKLYVAAVTLCMALTGITPISASATGESEEYNVDVEATEKEKPTDEEREKMKKKIEAQMEKWDKLSKEQKAEVYAIVAEEQAVSSKLIDKMVSLGILDKEDAAQIKLKMKDCFTRMKEDERFPLGRRRSPKERKCDSN